MNDVIKQLEFAINNALRKPMPSGKSPTSRPTTPAIPPAKTDEPGTHDKTAPQGANKDDHVTSPFGNRKLRGKEKFHAGTDIGMSVGTPVYAIEDGVVTKASFQDSNDPSVGGGLIVIITHENKKTSLYMHLSKALVSYRQKVVAGQQIGLSGNTGDTTGPHLHLEVRVGKSPIAPTQQEIHIAQSGK